MSFHLTITTCDVILEDTEHRSDFRAEGMLQLYVYSRLPDISVFYVSDYEGSDTTYLCVSSDSIKVASTNERGTKEVLSTKRHYR
jgi:hypothetical protein